MKPIAAALRALPCRDAILDGIVGMPNRASTAPLSLAAPSRLTFYAFDFLWLDDHDLRELRRAKAPPRGIASRPQRARGLCSPCRRRGGSEALRRRGRGRTTGHRFHHEEIAADAYEELRAGYEPAELPAAVTVASEWLARALSDRESGMDDDDRDALTLEEEAALIVLLGCLAVETQTSIAAGNRWAVMDVRYHEDEARITMASSAEQPADLA